MREETLKKVGLITQEHTNKTQILSIYFSYLAHSLRAQNINWGLVSATTTPQFTTVSAKLTKYGLF